MPNPVASFKTGLKVAIENTLSVAPNASTNPGWWQGGRWFDITTDGFPSLQDEKAIIFPAGQAGLRALNNRAPVVGRTWSEGGFGFPITEDFLGAMLYGALGGLSTNRVDGTNFSLLAAEPVVGGTEKLLVLTNQPSDGGAILRFDIKGASAGGTISISGIDSHGNPASEVISFASAGSFYSRQSFSAIGASSISISGSHGGGTVDVNGIQYWEHVFTFNNTSNPSFSIERYGDPTAGAASKSKMHLGMVVTELTFTNPASQEDGLFMGEVNFVGDPTATCNAGSLAATSAMKVWPAWTQKITKNGVNWYKATNFTMAINAGNRNYMTAAGTQNPQGRVYLGQEVTGSFDMLVDSEEEYNDWAGASSMTMVNTWTSPWKLTSSQNQQLIASLTQTYLESIDSSDDDGIFSLSGDYRTINDANNGLAKFVLRNGIPGTAYGNNVA